MPYGVAYPRSVRVADGRIVVPGGADDEICPVAGTQVYDPARDAWTLLAPIAGARTQHMVALLRDGRVIAAGGDRVSERLDDVQLLTLP